MCVCERESQCKTVGSTLGQFNEVRVLSLSLSLVAAATSLGALLVSAKESIIWLGQSLKTKQKKKKNGKRNKPFSLSLSKNNSGCFFLDILFCTFRRELTPSLPRLFFTHDAKDKDDDVDQKDQLEKRSL